MNSANNHTHGIVEKIEAMYDVQHRLYTSKPGTTEHQKAKAELERIQDDLPKDR